MPSSEPINGAKVPKPPTIRDRLLKFWLDWEIEPLFIEVRRKCAEKWPEEAEPK